jgi:hypothetical protein
VHTLGVFSHDFEKYEGENFLNSKLKLWKLFPINVVRSKNAPRKEEEICV